ncbi:MAG: GNAT family protein [Lachnospiraceae bacterium]
MKIELKRLKQSDREEMVDLYNAVDRKYISNRIPSPYTLEAADRWLKILTESDEKESISRAIILNGKIIGNISVEKKTDIYGRDGEIGYMLYKEYSGRGIMTEAVKQMCEIAFAQLDIIRITGCVFAANIASAKVLQNNGFLLEGTMKQAVTKNNTVYDLNIYGKTLAIPRKQCYNS